MVFFQHRMVVLEVIICLTLNSIEVETQKASITPSSNPKCITSTFISILPSSNTTIVSVTFNQDNSSYHDPSNLPYGTMITSQLPAYCSVLCEVTTSPRSSFRFLVWLPDKTWNQRFLMVGNGGFGGGLNYPDCGAGIKRGFACATTNTGHNSSVPDGSWAYKNTETIIDWGYRAMHISTVLSKQIVQQYYAPQKQRIHSYYQGCSRVLPWEVYHKNTSVLENVLKLIRL